MNCIYNSHSPYPKIQPQNLPFLVFYCLQIVYTVVICTKISNIYIFKMCY